jgi:hypothetical protein
MVVGDFTRQAPGRRSSRLLLATVPIAGVCWAAALILSHVWTWPVPAAVRLGFGAALLLAVPAWRPPPQLAADQAGRRQLIILALDATAITAVLLAASARTGVLGLAAAVGLGRIALTARTLPRLAVRWAHD